VRGSRIRTLRETVLASVTAQSPARQRSDVDPVTEMSSASTTTSPTLIAVRHSMRSLAAIAGIILGHGLLRANRSGAVVSSSHTSSRLMLIVGRLTRCRESLRAIELAATPSAKESTHDGGYVAGAHFYPRSGRRSVSSRLDVTSFAGHIGMMHRRDLTDNERAILITALRRLVDFEPQPLSPQTQALKAILERLEPQKPQPIPDTASTG
jgi:hypothetical protein